MLLTLVPFKKNNKKKFRIKNLIHSVLNVFRYFKVLYFPINKACDTF